MGTHAHFASSWDGQPAQPKFRTIQLSNDDSTTQFPRFPCLQNIIFKHTRADSQMKELADALDIGRSDDGIRRFCGPIA